MDEIVLVTLIGALSVALLLSLTLHVFTFRNVQTLQRRMSSLQMPKAEALPVPKETGFRAPVSRKDMDILLKRHNSIEESLRAMAELARVEGITLASRDGLVVASNYQDAQSDAATYSHLMKQGKMPEEPGLQVWQIEHKAGTLIGIARSKEQIDEEKGTFMKENVIKILNHWL